MLTTETVKIHKIEWYRYSRTWMYLEYLLGKQNNLARWNNIPIMFVCVFCQTMFASLRLYLKDNSIFCWSPHFYNKGNELVIQEQRTIDIDNSCSFLFILLRPKRTSRVVCHSLASQSQSVQGSLGESFVLSLRNYTYIYTAEHFKGERMAKTWDDFLKRTNGSLRYPWISQTFPLSLLCHDVFKKTEKKSQNFFCNRRQKKNDKNLRTVKTKIGLDSSPAVPKQPFWGSHFQ